MASSLGSFEALILLSVLRLGDAAYGASIQRDIAGRTGREPALGALYTTLERLSRKGLVSARIGAPTAVRGGRRTKRYRLEAPGADALAATWNDWRSMTEGLATRLDDLAGMASGAGDG